MPRSEGTWLAARKASASFENLNVPLREGPGEESGQLLLPFPGETVAAIRVGWGASA